MSFFAWAMMSLSVSPTMLQLYIFWELVGLSSYLLIGFWYEKFSATQAGKKAFVMTRAGDVAFFIGFLLLFLHTGNLSILDLNGPAASAAMSPGVLTLSALLIFGGIVGKSAQFPLLTWLPDAMEGPTPVSALLHSATMVAAGVYLFARLFPFFSLSPTAMSVFLAIGTISMLLASTMAMVSRDIKKVWAYSTISQLGFMIMALGAGGYFAGVFHLTTHAGFKALLFLCSGVFIHHYGTNDIYELRPSRVQADAGPNHFDNLGGGGAFRFSAAFRVFQQGGHNGGPGRPAQPRLVGGRSGRGFSDGLLFLPHDFYPAAARAWDRTAGPDPTSADGGQNSSPDVRRRCRA